MTSGANKVEIRPAKTTDIEAIKTIADAHRHELGFLRRPSLLASIDRQEIFVAAENGHIVGFVEYHHRRDEQTTLYNIAVQPDYRNQGIGQQLVEALKKDGLAHQKTFIYLKCPEDLSSNRFYRQLQFQLIETLPGKTRPLNIWQLDLA